MIKSGKHRSARQKDETLKKPSWPMKQRSSGGPGDKGQPEASHRRGKAQMGAAWRQQKPRSSVGSPIESIDKQGDKGGVPIQSIGGRS